MKSIVSIAVLFVALTAHAKEEKEINIPFPDCMSQVDELSKKAVGKVLDLSNLKLGMYSKAFETKTHNVMATCSYINGGSSDYLSVTTWTIEEFKAANKAAADATRKKSDALASKLGI
jgi:hypothetical protein